MAEQPVKQRSFWRRVTEFIKNPTQDWSLTRHENALREQQEQEHQRAREEQRKLDSFIRKRELAALRRLRKQQASGEAADLVFSDLPDTGAGMPQAPQREATLRKINEIERAMVEDSTADLRSRAPANATTVPMSQQRSAALPSQNTQALSFAATDVQSRQPAPASQPGSELARAMQPTVPAPTQLAPTQLAATQLAPTQLAATQMAATQMAPTRIGPTEIGAPPMARVSGEDWASSEHATDPTHSLAVDVQEGVSSSPLFDQACMDFANGNDQGAERALLEAISGSPDRKLENEFWLALFDLYRAGGDLQHFEALVTDYVDRFQSSAPSWGVAMPAAPTSSSAAGGSFTALGELDVAQAQVLLTLARGGSGLVALEFSALTSIKDGAQAPLLEALKVFNAAAGRNLEVSGLDHLLEACAAQAPAMQREADAAWWGIRLEALRLAGAQEAFESIALDYCVTYEISPPSWEPSRARVRLLNSSEAGIAGGSSRVPGAPSSRAATRFSSAETNGVAAARLLGEISGGSEDFLKPLDEAAEGHGSVLVDLSGLRRMDFASAGIVLNWVMSQSSAGREVRFEGTHRLVAGLFAILGISSVAQVDLRKS